MKLRYKQIPYRQLFGQFANHAVQVVRQALKLLVGGLKEVGTSPGQQPQSPPAIVGVTHNPERIYEVKNLIIKLIVNAFTC